MFDLAGYNEYELIGFWFDGPGNQNDLFAPVRDYSAYFPELSKVLQDKETSKQGKYISELQLPDIALTVVYRKVKDKAFAGALEQSTSVGAIPDSITSSYKGLEDILHKRNVTGMLK